MKTRYDPEADAFYAHFAPDGAEIAETREVAPGVMLDLDTRGELVGVEVLKRPATRGGRLQGHQVGRRRRVSHRGLGPCQRRAGLVSELGASRWPGRRVRSLGASPAGRSAAAASPGLELDLFRPVLETHDRPAERQRRRRNPMGGLGSRQAIAGEARWARRRRTPM